MGRLISLLGRFLVEAVDAVGKFSILLYAVIVNWPAVFRSRGRVADQMLFVGVASLPLIILTSVFIGAVSTWQTAYQIKSYVPMRYLGTAVGRAIVIELAPVLTALVVAGRVGHRQSLERSPIGESSGSRSPRCDSGSASPADGGVPHRARPDAPGAQRE